MPKLRIGTCSWKYPSWQGLVYAGPAGPDALAEYARVYNTVEVDQWFWSLFDADTPQLPLPAEAEGYRCTVPDDFRFTVKVPNSITLTHHYAKAKGEALRPNPHFLSQELFAEFLASLAPLGETLGPLIFQFEYLNRQKMSGQAEFQERLGEFAARLPAGRQYALEIRNPNYLDKGYFDFLREAGLIPALLEGYWMPAIGDVLRNHPQLLDLKTLILRLHGPDREGMEKQTGGRWVTTAPSGRSRCRVPAALA